MVSNAMTVSVKVDGTETLKEDLVTAMKEIGNGCIHSLVNYVVPEIKDLYKRHVQTDIYDKWEPTEYIRRGESGGLIDFDHNGSFSPSDKSMSEEGFAVGIKFRYRPDGSSEQWEHPLDTDDLIRRIETGQGYEWRKHPGPRPFWTNFLNEAIEGNAFADAVMRGLESYGIQVDGFPYAERESTDGYEY